MSSGRLSSLSTCVGFLLLLSSLGLILGQIIYGQVRVGKDEEWKAYISTFGASWGSDHVAWSLDGDTNGWFHAPPSAPWGPRRYKIPGRTESLSQCVSSCNAIGGTPACIRSSAESEWLTWTILGNVTGNSGEWFVAGAANSWVTKDIKDRFNVERAAKAWLGRYQTPYDQGAAVGWGNCMAGDTVSYTNWDTNNTIGVDEDEMGQADLDQHGIAICKEGCEPDDLAPFGIDLRGAAECATVDFGGRYTRPGAGMSPATAGGYWAETGKWSDSLCSYTWHVNLPYGGLYHCLCEDGTTDPAALAALGPLEERAKAISVEQRSIVISKLARTILPLFFLPLILHMLFECILWRRQKAKARKELGESGAKEKEGRAATPSVEKHTKKQLLISWAAGQRLRSRVSNFFLYFGWFLICFAISPMFVGMIMDASTDSTMLHAKFYGVWIPYGLTTILLSATPVDTARITTLCWVFLFAYFAMFMFYGLFFSILSTRSSWSGVFLWPYCVAAFQGLIRVFRTCECCCTFGSKGLPCCSCRGCCCCPKRMQSREKLRILWAALRTWALIGWVILFFISLSNHAPPFKDSMNPFMWAMMCSWGACALLPTPRNRGRLHNWLGGLGKSGSEEQEAAMVAALIGGTNPAAAYGTAVRKFCGLRACDITMDDLESNTDSADMHARTKRMPLGSIDAFVSHSWRDSGAAKYKMLETWAEDYRQKNEGEEPVVWLDKACIDQENIEENLLALPVYLSGCKELLVLKGPSYSSRLWCIMELFTFLKMGGTRSRIVLKGEAQGDDDKTIKRELLKGFDASKAQCHVAEDRQRLLGVIEAGCGSLDAFNSIVQKKLTDPEEANSPTWRRPTFRSSKTSDKMPLSGVVPGAPPPRVGPHQAEPAGDANTTEPDIEADASGAQAPEAMP